VSEFQLRVYRIVEGRLDDFVAAWLQGVKPLRERHGFVIEHAFTAEANNEFVWILRYDGPGAFVDADRAYYDSPRRADMDPDPAQYIVATEERMIRPVG
jgi:hypothetical protein